MRASIVLAILPVVAILGMAPLAVATLSHKAPVEAYPCQTLDPTTGLAVGQRILGAIQPGERLGVATSPPSCTAETPAGR